MKFLTDENGALYAYDEQSGLTLQFIGGKWDLAPVTYIVLAHDDKFLLYPMKRQFSKRAEFRRTDF